MEKRFLFFILCFCSILNPLYSIDINELVNSYDYTYSQGNFKLNSYQLKTIDENKIGLELNITAKPQNYVLDLILSSKENANIKSESFSVENLVNLINLTLEVSNLIQDNYTLLLFIYDEKGVLVYRNYNLSKLEINSEEFFLDNSYELLDTNTTYLKLNLTNEEIFYEPQIHILEDYIDYLYFSDLAIKNISYDNLTGNVTIEFVNFENDAIWYDFSVFDENFNLIHCHFENYLLQNQSKNVSLNLESNLSSFYVILDYSNNILENHKFNNILKWPVNLTENCTDDLDNNRDGSLNENCNSKIISQNNTINQNLQENNSITISFASGGSGGGGGSDSESKIGDAESNLNALNVITLNKNENQNKKEDKILTFLENLESEIGVSNLNSEYVRITYKDTDIILSQGESTNLEYENKTVLVRYNGVYLEKALFDFEFEDRKEKFEFISKLEENNQVQDKIKEFENNDSFEILVDVSSNLYNSSQFYYLNDSLDKFDKSFEFNLNPYFFLILVIIAVFLLIFFMR